MTLLYDKPLSLYLHIPFCTTKCTYCAFNTYTNLEQLIPNFINALITEIKFVGQRNPYQPVISIYFGGGTPSLLSSEQFKTVLQVLDQYFSLAPDCEITIEANPNDLTLPYLGRLREIGINRLSIGMQSSDEDELQLFARRHDTSMVINVVEYARLAGFDNLSLDLIYGVPNQTIGKWRLSVEQVLALIPEHLSIYALGLEDGTPMKNWVAGGHLPEPDDDLTADMYELVTDMLTAEGYEQYEISNWAKVGYASRHNTQYWMNLPYLGFGPGAHGFASGVRYSVLRSPQRYIQVLKTNTSSDLQFPLSPAIEEFTKISYDDEIAETIMTNLRLLSSGLSLTDFELRFGQDLLSLKGDVIAKFVDYGLLKLDTNTLRITRRGRLLSNAIFRELI